MSTLRQVCGLILDEARALKIVTRQKPLKEMDEQGIRDLVRVALLSLYRKANCADTSNITDKSYTRVSDVIGVLDQSKKKKKYTARQKKN
jgi:hypothetical protein